MISVVMSVYNEKLEWLEKAVNSILLQTYSDLEFIIVVDNPLVPEHIRNYIENKGKQDSRIVILYNETNLGLALSLNRGISIARGNYIARMDADDIAFPERLQCEIDYLEKHGVDMVSTNAVIIDEESCELRKMGSFPENPMPLLRYSNNIVHPSVLIRSDVIRKVGGYRNFKRSQDYDLWLRLMAAGYQIRTIDAYLMKYRVRSSSITKGGRLEQYYINLYQKSLYKERIRKGSDSFSEDRLKAYLASKRINQKKNQRCIEALDILDNQKEKVWLRTLKSFFIFPSLTMRIVINNLKKRYTLIVNRR
jgi:glycosyltransferase involved in cell wall biosynthesis